MSKLLDWAEKSGLENLKWHRETADLLQKQAVTTLTVLLAGATGGLAFVIKGVEHNSLWWVIGSAAFSVYLYALCALLVFNTLRIKSFPSLYNEPKNLFQPAFTLEEMKEAELANIQERIEQAGARNEGTSNWLNRIRYAAVASPMVLLSLLWWRRWWSLPIWLRLRNIRSWPFNPDRTWLRYYRSSSI